MGSPVLEKFETNPQTARYLGAEAVHFCALLGSLLLLLSLQAPLLALLQVQQSPQASRSHNAQPILRITQTCLMDFLSNYLLGRMPQNTNLKAGL